MEIAVVYKAEFENQINNLFDILIEKKYFSFSEDAVNYIENIFNFIENSIELPISKICPENFRRFGKRYLRYKANQHTYWYIFFDQKDNRYIVNHILNNHSYDFPELM